MLKICIMNLGKYNEGEFLYKWVELPVSEEELTKAYDDIKICHDEECFIADFETDLELTVREFDNIRELNEAAKELQSCDYELVKAILEADGGTLKQALEQVDSCVLYEDMDMDDVARMLVDEYTSYEMSELVSRYFDYEAFASDLHYDGYIEVSNGVIYIG